jgi:hypothetical protein
LQLNLNFKPTHNISPGIKLAASILLFYWFNCYFTYIYTLEVYVTGDTFVSSGMVPPFPVDDMSENEEEDKK